MAKHCLNLYNANNLKVLYSFIVFKHVNLIIRKEKYILGRMGLYFLGGIWGRNCIILGILGAKAKYFQGAKNFFVGFGEINAFFGGTREHRPPGGLLNCVSLCR